MEFEGKHCSCVLKMYPYEWIVQELENDDLLSHDLEEMEFVEPAWKIILANKSILPMLWEMFPYHPNLLPAYFIDPKYQIENHKVDQVKTDKNKKMYVPNYTDKDIKQWVSKPRFGREGYGV